MHSIRVEFSSGDMRLRGEYPKSGSGNSITAHAGGHRPRRPWIFSLGMDRDPALLIAVQILDALWTETAVHPFLHGWLSHPALEGSGMAEDQLRLLTIRMAHLKHAYCTGELDIDELTGAASALQVALVSFEQHQLLKDPRLSYRVTTDRRSLCSWRSARHEYTSAHAVLCWNRWRTCCIMLHRLQEALERRAMMHVAPQSRRISPGPERPVARSRQTIVDDICASISYALPPGLDADPPHGALSMASSLLLPLMVAGTHCIEQLSSTTITADGRRLVFVTEVVHLNTSDPTSAQLAYIIDRMDYMANVVGLRRAAEVGHFLKGERRVYYDLGRS